MNRAGTKAHPQARGEVGIRSDRSDYALLLALAVLIGVACLTLVPNPIGRIVEGIARIF